MPAQPQGSNPNPSRTNGQTQTQYVGKPFADDRQVTYFTGWSARKKIDLDNMNTDIEKKTGG